MARYVCTKKTTVESKSFLFIYEKSTLCTITQITGFSEETNHHLGDFVSLLVDPAWRPVEVSPSEFVGEL